MGGKEAYLSRSRLWKIRYDEDLLGCRERTDHFADLQCQFLREPAFIILVV